MSNAEGSGPEWAVREALAKIHAVESTAKQFSKESGDRDVLAQRINEFVSSLGSVRGAVGALEAEFPVELLRRLDTGINPDKFLVDAFHTCVVENQKVKGKALDLGKFHDALLEHATRAFPEEAEAYRHLKSRMDTS